MATFSQWWFFFQAVRAEEKRVSYGYKGKGVTGHLLVDGNGSPLGITVTGANGNEKKQEEPLLDKVQEKLTSFQQRTGCIPLFEAGKGYDADYLRKNLLRKAIYPWICRRRKPGEKATQKIKSMVKR